MLIYLLTCLKKFFTKNRLFFILVPLIWSFLSWLSVSYLISKSLGYYRARTSYYNKKKSLALQDRVDCIDLKKRIIELNRKISDSIEPLIYLNHEYILRKILDQIFISNLNIDIFKPGLLIHKKWYSKAYLNLEVTGSYYDILEFFSKLERLNTPINIQQKLLCLNKEILSCKVSLKFYMFKNLKEQYEIKNEA